MTSHPSNSKQKSKPEPPKVRNARIIQKYTYTLRHQKGLSDATIGHHLSALNRFNTLTNNLCFKSFNDDVAVKFKMALAKELDPRKGTPLAQATIDPIIRKVRAFIEWLAREPGYRSKLKVNDIGFLRPKLSDVRQNQSSIRKFPSLRNAMEAFDKMPTSAELEQRNKAYLGMHLLTSGRTKAIITLPIVAFDFKFKKVSFDSRLCKTKRQSSFTSFFNPVPKRVSKCVRAWIRLLETKYNFSPLDPIFPMFTHPWETVSADGIRPTKKQYKSGHALVGSFRAAFDAVGIEGITPHSLRTTMFREVEKLADTRMESKVFSMNLGQKDELVLLNSYSNVSEYEQEKTMRRLRKKAQKQVRKKEKLT